jgi:signal peptidase I
MKKLLVFGVGLILITAMTVGIVYAWTAKPSDVGNPIPSPNANTVKYHVIGTSMSPTINDGDWLVVNTDDHDIVPGDIIIMRLPKDPDTVYCRRVVAVAGDVVHMKYYSNVKQTTIDSPDQTQPTIFPMGVAPVGNAYGEYDTTVDTGNLYVVGDNTEPGASYDSDEWGELPLSDVVGVVVSRTSPNPKSF